MPTEAWAFIGQQSQKRKGKRKPKQTEKPLPPPPNPNQTKSWYNVLQVCGKAVLAKSYSKGMAFAKFLSLNNLVGMYCGVCVCTYICTCMYVLI